MGSLWDSCSTGNDGGCERVVTSVSKSVSFSVSNSVSVPVSPSVGAGVCRSDEKEEIEETDPVGA